LKVLQNTDKSIQMDWNIVQGINPKYKFINLSFELGDTRFLCVYTNAPEFPELIKVSRNDKLVYDVAEVKRIKHIADANEEAKRLERREKLIQYNRYDAEIKE